MAGAAVALGACGFADMRTPLPELMRAKTPILYPRSRRPT